MSANFSGPERGRALGLYFAAGAIAAVVGPIVGGLLASSAGWPAIFWMQVPLAVGVAVLAARVLPWRAGGIRRSLDLPGLAAGSTVLLAITVALLQASAWGWTSPAVLGCWLVAAVALIAFVLRERHAAEPAVRLSVFGSRIFVASTIVGAAAWFGIISGSVQLSIYLQEVRGLEPIGAALVLMPWPLLAGLLFPRAGAIVARIGPERVMLGSLALAALAAACMALFTTTTPLLVVSLLAALGGVPLALGVTASTVCALAEFAPSEAAWRPASSTACARSGRCWALPSRPPSSTWRLRRLRPTAPPWPGRAPPWPAGRWSSGWRWWRSGSSCRGSTGVVLVTP